MYTANHHRKGHVLPIARFVLVVAVAVCVSGACIYYGWCRNQIDRTGREIAAKEAELAKLKSQIDVVKAKIARLSSTATLQQRLASGFFKLEPIWQLEPTVRLAGSDDDDVRPVSNSSRVPRP
jgi:cell division protein FtsB